MHSWRVACCLQSHNTGRINICRRYMVSCQSGLYLQTSKAGTLYVHTNGQCTNGRLPPVYSAVMQKQSLYVDIIWWPAPVVCIYKPVRQVHYMPSTLLWCKTWKNACPLQSHKTGLINICRQYMMTCSSGLYLQTSKACTVSVQNNG